MEKITAEKITAVSRSTRIEFSGITMTALLDDNTSTILFHYYDDKIEFSDNELIGLSLEEARELRTKKDIAYLQS